MGEGKPEKACGDAPVWWHQNGVKMRPLFGGGDRTLQVFADAATLTISPNEHSRNDRDRWLVAWEIRRISPCGINGKTAMSAETLCRAFGLAEGTAKSSAWLLQHYGADSAEQGCYIRSGDCLNIPGPGTGRDGDPNISVLLDEDIKEAARHILGLP